MGSAVRSVLREFPDLTLAACVAPREPQGGPTPGPLWLTPEEFETRRRRDGLGEDTVVVDFSLAAGTSYLVKILLGWPRALVCATTGIDALTETRLDTLAERVAVFRAANLSPGFAVMQAMLRALPGGVKDSFRADMIEHHHAGKKDAPSGSALVLADTLRSVGWAGPLGDGVRIQSIRAGTEPGTHEVLLSGSGETVELTHRVHDRSVFARGALRAARFLRGRAPGRYGMDDLLA
jgi:4-hydroxy-tetrahydrodipicolinate reductase